MAQTKVTKPGIADDAVETSTIKNLNVTNAKIAAGTIDVTAKITGIVPAANLGTGTASATTYLAGDGSYKALSEYDDNTVQSNIAMLGFKVATNGSLVKYDLVKQTIDEFNDTSGVDASASTNEARSAGAPYYYYGESVSAGETISATGGTGGSGGTGTGGTSQGTGGNSNSNGTSGGAGGGGNGQGGTGGANTGGNGDASYYTGGGGGGAKDNDGGSLDCIAGGTGYFTGGTAGTPSCVGTAGAGVGGSGSSYGAGNAGTAGSGRNNNGGGGAFAGGGGGGNGDGNNSSGSTGGQGGGGGVIITYTNSGAQVVPKFSGTSYTVPSGSTDLIIYVVGAGAGGGYSTGGGGTGGGGGGMAKSNTFADAVRSVTFTLGAGGAGSGSAATGGSGGTSSVTIGSAGAGGGDLTLQSTDTTASTANPDYADMVCLMENAYGTATLNTDIKGYISEDSGVTFTQGTLVDEGTWGTNKKIVAFHDLDISAQTGSAMCYKITTHNQSAGVKETKIHATSIGWR